MARLNGGNCRCQPCQLLISSIAAECGVAVTQVFISKREKFFLRSGTVDFRFNHSLMIPKTSAAGLEEAAPAFSFKSYGEQDPRPWVYLTPGCERPTPGLAAAKRSSAASHGRKGEHRGQIA